MKRTLFYTGVCLTGLLLFGCNNQCRECEDQFLVNGNFRLVLDWTKLWQGIEKPEEMNVYFYHSDLAPLKDKIYTDTTYYSLPSGRYNIVAVNNAGMESYTGMDHYYTAQVTLPVSVTDSLVTTMEAPLYLAAHHTGTIGNTFKEGKMMPAPIIKIIHFTFRIKSGINIESIRAELEGVQTSAMLFTGEQTPGAACLPFMPVRKKENHFYKPISILGFAPGTINLLSVRMTCRNGSTLETVTDLSGKFDFQTSPVQSCTLYYDLENNGLEPEVKIESWQPGINQDIHIY